MQDVLYVGIKEKVISEYLSIVVCKMPLLKKYGIKYKSGIQKWMQQMYIDDIWYNYMPFKTILINELWESIKQSYKQAFDLLFERYWQIIFTNAFSYLNDRETCCAMISF